MRTRNRWALAVGLALLYTSEFYLPQVGSYYVPRLIRQILYPVLVAVAVLCPLGVWFHRRYGDGGKSDFFGVIGVAALCWIAVVSAFSAAGYSALSVALILVDSQATVEATRWTRAALAIGGVTASVIAVYYARRFWGEILRFLSILGYAFALLAVVRVAHFPQSTFALGGSSPEGLLGLSSAQETPAPNSGPSKPLPREVIWIIMDELDYDKTLGVPGGPQNPPMPNLEKLASIGVSASNAYPPAKDTSASLPALLSGYPLEGMKFKDGGMLLGTRNAGVRKFQESDSVFGRLPAGPGSAAIIGFHHPYCTLFPAVAPCISSPFTNVGRWFDALAFFGEQAIATARYLPYSVKYVPGSLFYALEPMYRITVDTLREFPRFLSIDDKALVFIHVNLPHPPGDYAQRVLHLKSAGDERESYRRNLKLVDDLIGETLTALRSRPPGQEILLILSADHWHRIESPLVAKRIPWIGWHVGEADGIRLESPLSSVLTADLVLAFLRGTVNDQSQIAAWWNGKPFYPTLMPHGFEY